MHLQLMATVHAAGAPFLTKTNGFLCCWVHHSIEQALFCVQPSIICGPLNQIANWLRFIKVISAVNMIRTISLPFIMILHTLHDITACCFFYTNCPSTTLSSMTITACWHTYAHKLQHVAVSGVLHIFL